MLHSNVSRTSDDTAQDVAEQFVQSALDAMSAHIAILDDVGGIIGVNSAWKKFARQNGYRGNDFGIGTNYLGVCDTSISRNRSSEAQVVVNGIRQVMSGTASEFKLEYPCHSPTEKRWFVVRVSRFQWYNEIRYIIAHQNVTELKRIQIELMASKRRLQAILDNVSNGIVSFNADGVIDTANRAATRIFGHSMEELINTSVFDLIAEPNFDDEIANLFHYGGDQEILGKRKNGMTFPAYFEVDQFRLNGSHQYTVIVRDISVRRQMETEIIEKERLALALEQEREMRTLKNRFLSMMSHELRTPLTSIRLSTDMLGSYDQQSTPQERQQAVRNIVDQVGHLSEMVSDVISLSRSDTESIQFEPEKVDIVTYCRDILEEFQFTHHKTHQIDFESTHYILYAPVDRKLIRRAITNLLSNAVKYSPTGGRVFLSVEETDDHIVIQVRDSGIGIPEKDVEHLFEPFHRAANVENLPGTGLGLAIAKQAIEVHGGGIAVDSEPEKGTTFTIWLPTD